MLTYSGIKLRCCTSPQFHGLQVGLRSYTVCTCSLWDGSVGWNHLLPSLRTWSASHKPTCWKGKKATLNCPLISICTLLHMYAFIHINSFTLHMQNQQYKGNACMWTDILLTAYEYWRDVQSWVCNICENLIAWNY